MVGGGSCHAASMLEQGVHEVIGSRGGRESVAVRVR